jgi:hypothetical protein
MRIFIGFTDIANIANVYAQAFKELGHQTFTATWSKSYFYPDSDYDVVIDQRAWGKAASRRKDSFKILVKALGGMAQFPRALKCDLFITFAPALLPVHLIYPWLKRLGKKLVCPFWGSDIRYWYAYIEEMTRLGIADEFRPFIDYYKENPGPAYQDKLRLVQTTERYADLILSQPGYAQLQTRPYMRATIPLELSQLQFNLPERKIPLVVHAPSVRSVKGTEYVLTAIEKLKAENIPFEFRLIEKMPNSELRRLLATSDIVIDQLFSETVATLAAEGMATGNAVLTRYIVDFAGVPEGCPAVNATRDNLADELRALIMDNERRRQLAYAGRTYVENYNNHLKVAGRILEQLQSSSDKDYDFIPTFYRDFQIPDDLVEKERKRVWELRKQTINKYLFLLPGSTAKTSTPAPNNK